jgi:hypothetical protein
VLTKAFLVAFGSPKVHNLNAQKSLKQAIGDHIKLILGTFCDFIFFKFLIFLLILVGFSI